MQLKGIKGEKVQQQLKENRKLNAELRSQVLVACKQLEELEQKNGKKIITVPGLGLASESIKVEESVVVPESEAPKGSAGGAGKEKKPKKEKPVKVEGGGNNTATAEASVEVVDVGRLDFRVGKIVEVSKHPDADSLYLEKIDCGEAKPRTVVSGLVKFVPIEEMQNRMVVILCNLKPAKMRGVTSEAMVMCASTPEKVEVLAPPAGSVPGDIVVCEGYPRNPDAQLNPKKKIFETVAPDLKTNGELIACYKGKSLVVEGKGAVIAQTLKNVQVK